MIQSELRGLLNLLGIVIWGDFADMTMYRCHGKLILFGKTRPEKPPSDLQVEQRAKFSAAVDAWNGLTQDQRDTWELATRRLSLCLHGWNLYLHWQLTDDTSAIQTIERQTGLTLLA